jgi:hypothetical protein
VTVEDESDDQDKEGSAGYSFTLKINDYTPRGEQSHRQRRHQSTRTTAQQNQMHINWKPDQSLLTTANIVTEVIPPNEEGPQQGVQT